MQKSLHMNNKPLLAYDINVDSAVAADIAASSGPVSPQAATIPMRREQLDQGMAATLLSGTEGDRQALIGSLELMECAAQNGMTVLELMAWFDEYLVKPGYMRRPTRVFEYGVGTVYLGDARNRRRPQEATLRRLLQVARQEVCAMLTGLLENPPDDRFIRFNITTGRIYRDEKEYKRGWRVRARADDRLSGIVLNLLAADIMSNQHMYYQRLSVCKECGRISFRLDTTSRHRCPTHDQIAEKTFDAAV